MTKAKSKSEFESAWASEFNQLMSLCTSLPMGTVALDFIHQVEALEKKFIPLACAEVFPKSCFGHMHNDIVEASICIKHCKTFEERQNCACQTAELEAAEKES
jgi:hypothetical protein